MSTRVSVFARTGVARGTFDDSTQSVVSTGSVPWCGRVSQKPSSLYYCHGSYTRREIRSAYIYIYMCVYVVPPFSFVAHYAPMNGVRVRVRDSNRHPDHRRHFASVRTVNGERAESRERREHGRNEPFHDNGNSRRT